MALEMSRSIQAAERPRLSNSYLSSPFRTQYFVLPSLLCLLDLIFIAVISVKQWERLPGRSIFALALAAYGLFAVWLMSFRTQRTVRRYLKAAQIESLEPGSPLEAGLYVSAYVSYHGFLWTLGAVACCLAALSEFFIH
jgi:hypothetical protein